MESTRDTADALRRAERAAAAPYVDAPALPAWYPLAVGLWAAAFCLTQAIPSDSPTRVAARGGLVVALLAFVAWDRRHRGVRARGPAPQEVRRVLVAFVVGAVLVIGLLAAALWLVPAWLAAVVAFVVVTPSVLLYERAYATAAARARARLG